MRIITFSFLIIFFNLSTYADSSIVHVPLDYSDITFEEIKKCEVSITKHSFEIKKLETYLKNNNKDLIKRKINLKEFNKKNGRHYIDLYDDDRKNDKIRAEIRIRRQEITYINAFILEMKKQPQKKPLVICSDKGQILFQFN